MWSEGLWGFGFGFGFRLEHEAAQSIEEWFEGEDDDGGLLLLDLISFFSFHIVFTLNDFRALIMRIFLFFKSVIAHMDFSFFLI